MKKARLILSASMLTLAAFSAVTFSSCTKDDQECAVGLEGKNCDEEVRVKYNNTYRGDGYDNEGDTYTDWALKFSSLGTEPTKMQLDILNGSNTNVVYVTVTLTSNTTYTVEPKTTVEGDHYEGQGNLSATNASLTLRQTTPGGDERVIIYNFNDMIKQ